MKQLRGVEERADQVLVSTFLLIWRKREVGKRPELDQVLVKAAAAGKMILLR